MKHKKRAPRKTENIKSVLVDLGEIDYKSPKILRKFMDSRFKMLPQSVTGLSSKKQRKLKTEIKKARTMGLLPFTDRHAIS